MDEIVKQEKTERKEQITKINADSNNSVAVNRLLTGFLQCVNIGENFVKAINPDTDYFVKIPNYIKEGLRTGKYNLLQKKETGELLASVMESKNGKKSFFANLTLEEGAVVNEKYIQNMSDGMFNLMMQQQLQQISMQLSEIEEIVKRLERSQKHDRVGLIKGAIMQLQNAEKNSLDNRALDISNARQSLYTAINAIGEEIKDRISTFEAVPHSKVQVYGKIILSFRDYVPKKETEYNEIKSYLDYYFLAYQALAYAALLEDRKDKVADEYEECRSFIEGLDLSKIQSLENLYIEKRLSREWFNRPKEYVEEQENKFLAYTELTFDAIEINIKGKDLLEVLSDDKN